MTDQRDSEPGGPWYSYREVCAMGGLCNEHGEIADPDWMKHKTLELWRRFNASKPQVKFGTMA